MAGRDYKRRVKEKAVTLIELLIAVSIFSLVGVGIYRTLSNSISLFSRIKQINYNTATLIFTETLASDLHNCFSGIKFPFYGEDERLNFFIHRPLYFWQNNDQPSIVKVEYIYKPETEEAVRRVYAYGSDVVINQKTVLQRVKNISWRYYKKNNSQQWYQKITELPVAVELKIEIENDRQYRAIFEIPLS
jgi:prepilin-type N-terminal cleavage/methylation domain-containing protein